MIENIKHYSMENLPSIFDEEALTALELVGRLAAKIRELIENYNALDVDIGGKLEEQDGRLDIMADEIATTKAELSEALETLIGTTMPAYVQKYVGDLLDAGAFDESMAEQLKKAAMLRPAPDVLDADACEEIGYYFVSSGDGEWGNTPGPGGLLMVVNSGDQNRHYQIFVDYQTAFMYVRRTENGAFSEWELVNARDTLMQKYFEPGEVDLNAFGETGFYILGSSSTYTNTPDGAAAGLLIVCKDSKGFQTYQIFVNYTNNSMYTRRAYNGSFNEWLKMGANEGGSSPVAPSDSSTPMFEVARVSDTSFKVFRKGPRGYVCYTIARETNDDIKQDVVRIQKITVCDAAKNTIYTLSDTGHDIECVVTDGPGNQVGGVHGYEKLASDYPLIFVDGMPFTMESIQDMSAETIEIYTESALKSTTGMSITTLNKEKCIRFADGHVELSHNLRPKTGLTDFAVTEIKTAMLSVNKNCFTHWYTRGDIMSGHNGFSTGEVRGVPVARADIGTTSAEIYDRSSEINEVFFTGSGILARLKAAYRSGPAEDMMFRMVDYGDRVKAYFCSHYDGLISCPTVKNEGSEQYTRSVTEIEIVY